jgi:hypothetical protein
MIRTLYLKGFDTMETIKNMLRKIREFLLGSEDDCDDYDEWDVYIDF